MVKLFIYIILIIILIWYLPIFQTNKISQELLHGFYIGDSSFIAEAGLSNLMLYLDNKTGHIFLQKSGGEIMLNDTFDWNISSDISQNLNADINEKRIFTIYFKEIESDAFPTKQTLEFYPAVGKIILRQKNTVFAVLYKDSVASEIKNLIPDNV